MTRARVFGLGFGIVLILAAFGIVLWQSASMSATNTAFAQGAGTGTPTAGATETPSAGTTTTPAATQQQQQAAIGDTFWTLLAGKLNVSPDDLKAKAVEARKEMIDQAVKDGRATQEQGDAIKQKITADNIIAPISLGRGVGPQNTLPNTNPPRRGPFGWFGNGQGPMPYDPLPGGLFGRGFLGGSLQELQAVATALKLDPKALIEQLSQGKSLADIAKAQNVDEATVKQAIIDARKAEIDQQLSLGLISEVQANALKARLTPDNIDLSRGFRFPFRIAPAPSASPTQQSS